MRPDPRRRPLAAILCAGLAVTLLVIAGGWGLERLRLGRDDQAAAERVEAEVRQRVERISRTQRAAAAGLSDAARPVLARPPDERDLRPLFAQAEALTSADSFPASAITVYGTDGSPLAWSGRPSQVPVERLTQGPRLFVARGPLGVRLVATAPVVEPRDGAALLGTVAAEALLTTLSSGPGHVASTPTMTTALAPVALRPAGEAAERQAGRHTFVLRGDAGQVLVEAWVAHEDLAAARARHRRAVLDLAWLVAALTLLLLAGPLLDRRQRARDRPGVLRPDARGGGVAGGGPVALVGRPRARGIAAVLAGRLPLRGARRVVPPPGRLSRDRAARHRARGPVRRPRRALAAHATRGAPPASPRRRSRGLPRGAGAGGCRPGGGGGLVRTLPRRHLRLVGHRHPVPLPHPWNTGRVALDTGLLLFHAAVAWALVLALRGVLGVWRVGADLRAVAWLVPAWGVPIVLGWTWWSGTAGLPRVSGLLASAAMAAAAFHAPRGLTRLRHASQGYRLAAMFVALLLPSLLFYPSLVSFEDLARRRVIETRFAPEVLNQRENLQRRLQAAQEEIDRRAEVLRSVVSVPPPPPGQGVSPDSAFLIWQDTALERYRVSSAIELYNAARAGWSAASR